MGNVINRCSKCGFEGVIKSIANGNVAVLCTNSNCKNSSRAKSGFKGSDRMAVDDWNNRNKAKT